MKKIYEKSDRTPEETDYIYMTNAAADTEWRVALKDVTDIQTTTQTINFNNTMTRNDIQDLINAVPKYIKANNVVTFQFANGTYNLDSGLFFQGFYGGQININGDTGQSTSLHTNQNVHLNFNNGSHGLRCINNTGLSQIVIQNLKITTDDGLIGIALENEGWGRIRYCYLLSTGQTSSGTFGIWATRGFRANVYNTYVSNSYVGIFAQLSARISSESNDDTGTQPKYGLGAYRASVVGKGGTQPSGATADETIANGGLIR